MRARRASACCACELSEQGGRSDEGRPASSARGVNGGRGQLGVAERSSGAWRRRREDRAAGKDAQVGRGGGLACAVLCSGVLRVRKERGRRRKEGEKKKRKGKKEKERERGKRKRESPAGFAAAVVNACAAASVKSDAYAERGKGNKEGTWIDSDVGTADRRKRFRGIGISDRRRI